MKKVSKSTVTSGSAPSSDPPDTAPLLTDAAATASTLLTSALDSASQAAAFSYLKDQLTSLHSSAHKGPMTFRVLSFLGGLAMILQCSTGTFGKLFSFSPLQALIEVYCLIFGVITVILEGQEYAFLRPFRTSVQSYCKLLTYTWGRGVFYMFSGSLMFSQFNLFDMLIGGYMCFIGFTSLIIGQQTANKLTDLKKTLASESVVKEKFKAMDVDGNGTLDSKELAALCKSLGSPLDHNELVAAISTMDKDGSGSISYEEFYGWWSGWSYEKE
eukprot:CAMPEP_0182511752 /NCGR_PEP_ID=MMETSP1321-20130603/31002_1 /TAXON_ID=91990 /ORGANISM="Bolidomonas sp., Strain RCC1657" /LENGTH=271 /DNA_ID=CAMNT_0024718461 /DNA_START=33 /DNA_END=845 /DNA_ORIENTATION=+